MKNLVKTFLYITIMMLSSKLEAIKVAPSTEIDHKPEPFATKQHCRSLKNDIRATEQRLNDLRNVLPNVKTSIDHEKVSKQIYEAAKNEGALKHTYENECSQQFK